VTAVQMFHACHGVTEGQFDVGHGSQERVKRDRRPGDSVGALESPGGESQPLLPSKMDKGDAPDSWGKMRRILRDPSVYAITSWSIFYVGCVSSQNTVRQ